MKLAYLRYLLSKPFIHATPTVGNPLPDMRRRLGSSGSRRVAQRASRISSDVRTVELAWFQGPVLFSDGLGQSNHRSSGRRDGCETAEKGAASGARGHVGTGLGERCGHSVPRPASPPPWPKSIA